MRTCSACLQSLPETAFHPSAARREKALCRDCRNKQVAERYRVRAAAGLCYDCPSPALPGHKFCAPCKEARRIRFLTVDHDKQLAAARARRQETKLEAFNAYGGPTCVCCGESRMEFLSLDHVNDDGAAHRRSISVGQDGRGVQLAKWCKQNGYPPGFQVLCFNCNFAKGHFDECPHERERRQSLVLVG
jgi:hypothetical protein